MTFWYRLCWWICRIGLFFWHPVLHVHGRELVPAGCALLCANHSGMADPIWIMLALNSPKMIRILAKEELRRVPFLGWVMEKFDIIFVRRGAHQPEVYEKTVKFLQCKDYLVYRLTGNMDSGDFSDASRAGLMNLQSRDYDYDMLENLGLHADKFPTLRPSCAIAGRLTEEAAYHLGLRAGIPVSVGGGNGMCESVGAGVAQDGAYYMSLDTAAWIAGQSKEPFFDPQRRLGHICTLDGRSFSVFGAMRCAGKCVNWAQKLFEVGSPRAFDAAASNIPAGADGLIFLPYLEGERSPVYDEQAQGVFFGMTQQHRREHFLRAVLEGVGCGLSQILDVLRERGEILDLRIIGGGAKSKVWKQIIADLCEVRLHDVTTLSDSAATLGAAAAAGVGIGLYESLSQAVSCIAQASVLSPEEETYPAYRALRARYDLLYPAPAPVFHQK